MNILIIGYGAIGRIYYSILKKNKKINKIIIVDKISNKKKNIISFNDLKKIKVNINFAFVCSPSFLHFDHAKYCIKKKIDTLIEKPFVLSLKHSRELIQLAKKSNVRCSTVFQNRENLAIKKFRRFVKNNKILHVDMRLFWRRTKEYYSDGWHGKYEFDGGVLANQAIHMLDIMVNLFGKVRNYNVIAKFDKSKLEAEDYISINFNMMSGLNISFVATTRAANDYEVSIDALSDKSRCLVSGVSMNKLYKYSGQVRKIDKSCTESFKYGHGIHHKKIINDFIKKKLKGYEIEKNVYVLEIISSIYNKINKSNKLWK